jgi:hypothetical protein
MARYGRPLLTGRRWFLALAALALWIQVLVPQGYMVSTESGPPGLVICTGHGPLRLSGDHRRPAGPAKSIDSPCPFAAAHGPAAEPPTAVLVAAEPFAFVPAPPVRVADLAPGRGLAAPPPQSHAPPADLT